LLLVHARKPPVLCSSCGLDEGEGETGQDGDGDQLAEQHRLVSLKPAVVRPAVVLVANSDHNLEENISSFLALSFQYSLTFQRDIYLK